jgi:hypothetical protein
MEDSYVTLRREKKCVAFLDSIGKTRCEKTCKNGSEFCSEHAQRVRFHPRSRTGIVYVVYLGESDKNGSAYYKIGVTKNINRRIKDLRLSNPKVRLCKAFGTSEMYQLEKRLHILMKDRRTERETFLLSNDDLKQVIDNMLSKEQ